MLLLGMQAGGMAPKAPNQGGAGLKTSTDGSSGIIKHIELRIYLLVG
jgi:hypothetical protein